MFVVIGAAEPVCDLIRNVGITEEPHKVARSIQKSKALFYVDCRRIFCLAIDEQVSAVRVVAVQLMPQNAGKCRNAIGYAVVRIKSKNGKSPCGKCCCHHRRNKVECKATGTYEPDKELIMDQKTIIILVVAAVIVIAAISIYNSLVVLRARYKNAFAQIDVQLKRRYDLIPNLVETAKGYMKHERETLEAVIYARNQAAAAAKSAGMHPGETQAMNSLGTAEGALQGAMSRLLLTVERYPELKANENMLSLQEEIASTENKVSFARQAYNDAVTVYNTKCEVFPSNVFAGLFRFMHAELFEVKNEAERETPKVQF